LLPGRIFVGRGQKRRPFADDGRGRGSNELGELVITDPSCFDADLTFGMGPRPRIKVPRGGRISEISRVCLGAQTGELGGVKKFNRPRDSFA